MLGVARKGVVLLYWSGFVYKDDGVVFKIAMCPKVVIMLGVPPERVMCCCTVCKHVKIISGVALFSCTGIDLCINKMK